MPKLTYEKKIGHRIRFPLFKGTHRGVPTKALNVMCAAHSEKSFLRAIKELYIEDYNLRTYLNLRRSGNIDALKKGIKKLKKKSIEKNLWITINFDEKINSTLKGDPCKIINKITECSNIENFAYAYEWRDIKKETGLHCHILILQPDAKKRAAIVQHIKRQKFKGCTEVCKSKHTLKSYDWNDIKNGNIMKIKYLQGETLQKQKTELKSYYNSIRKKYPKFESFSNIYI